MLAGKESVYAIYSYFLSWAFEIIPDERKNVVYGKFRYKKYKNANITSHTFSLWTYP